MPYKAEKDLSRIVVGWRLEIQEPYYLDIYVWNDPNSMFQNVEGIVGP